MEDRGADRRSKSSSVKRVSMGGVQKAKETNRPVPESSNAPQRVPGKDVTTQVRPRIPNCDLAAIAQNVEGQYCLLTKILNTLRSLRDESQANFEQILQTRADKKQRAPAPKDKDNEKRGESTRHYAWSTDDSSPKLHDDAQITGAEEVTSLGSNEPWSNTDLKCPDTCPTCGTTVKILLAEIDELRRTRRFMLKVRQDANNILDEVVDRALTHQRVKLYSTF